MSKAKTKLIAAEIMQVLLKNGVKLKSPYCFENFFTDEMTHEVLGPFFYDEANDGAPLNLANEIQRVIADAGGKP